VTRPDLFISDLHLDAGADPRRAALVRFLDRHGSRAGRLFVLGDLFNVWIGRKQLGQKDVAEVTAAIRRLTASGVEVYFVAGNRDFYGLRHLARATGMTTHPRGFATESFGQRVWVCHGHDLFVHDRRTHMAQRVTHSWPVEWLFQGLPAPLAMFMARGYKNHSLRVVRHKSRRMLSIGDEAVLGIFEAGYRSIVCGHTHRLAHTIYRWPGGEGHLWNLGAWDQGPHFLRRDRDGWHFHHLESVR
jgi:UDP-2,3-diacylglucosamine hydrolase